MRALVVVDYQNDFVDGPLGGPDAISIESRICDRIEDVLGSGGSLFFTLDSHGDDYLSTLEGRLLPVPHCIEGTRGRDLHGRVAGYADRGELLCKSTFGCERLMDILRPFDEIEVCGVATNVCVIANAVIARTAAPDARVVVRRDCVASYDREEGEKALAVMPSLQIDVV